MSDVEYDTEQGGSWHHFVPEPLCKERMSVTKTYGIDMDKRIRSLEKWRWIQIGFVTCLSFIASFAGAMVAIKTLLGR